MRKPKFTNKSLTERPPNVRVSGKRTERLCTVLRYACARKRARLLKLENSPDHIRNLSLVFNDDQTENAHFLSRYCIQSNLWNEKWLHELKWKNLVTIGANGTQTDHFDRRSVASRRVWWSQAFRIRHNHSKTSRKLNAIDANLTAARISDCKWCVENETRFGMAIETSVSACMCNVQCVD